ncbi:MAG: four helix bundle protein [Nitrospirae bacterium]|nr:MAG: four helix bundle protein [Nitrospirota bacterium]
MLEGEGVKEKSYAFALKVIEVVQYLQKEKKEYVLSRQLMRSGTAIGANVEEASAAVSKKDFILKMSVASKEARETGYWLRLLFDSGYLNNERSGLLDDCEELIKILTAIVKTSQNSLTKN